MRFDFHKDHKLLFGTVLIGFIALSTIVAIAPARWVQRHTEPVPGSRELSALEQRGLRRYVAEGCVYCHTQQVRPLTQDTSRYGRPSLAGDYARLRPLDAWRHSPRVLGSERTGPDLSNIGARQPSTVWHYLHLYQPRAVVAGSVMPAFPWLFALGKQGDPDALALPAAIAPANGGAIVPTDDARAIVAYLLSLNPPPAPGVAVTAARTAGAGAVVVAGAAGVDGSRIFASNCSACHQPNGRGLPGAFPPLASDPVVTAADPTRHIEVVLFGASGSTIGGQRYTSPMPPWASLLNDEQVAAVINHERTSWGNAAPTVSAADVAAVRKRRAADAR